MSAGAKSTYTVETAERILDAMVEGRMLVDICRADDMPARRTVLDWLNKYPDFKKKYDVAREMCADALFEQTISISRGHYDDEIIERQKGADKELSRGALRHVLLAEREQMIRTLQAAAGKLRPQKYGATQQIEISGNADKPVTTVTRIEIVAPQLGQLGAAVGQAIEHQVVHAVASSQD